MAWPGSARVKSPRRTRRSLWVGWKPYGIGETRPNAYKEIVRTIWQNRRNLPYAWRILRKGVCDGCALGVAGFHDWTIDGVHLCMTRLNLLRLNTLPAIPDGVAHCEMSRGTESQAALFSAIHAFLANVAAQRPLVLLRLSHGAWRPSEGERRPRRSACGTVGPVPGGPGPGQHPDGRADPVHARSDLWRQGVFRLGHRALPHGGSRSYGWEV